MSATTAGRAVSDAVWVHAFGDWRRGVVVKVGRTRLRVRYVSRRDGTAEREQWFPAAEVHDGNLPASQSWHCGPCGYTIYGAPGRTAEQLRDDHNAQRHTPAPVRAEADDPGTVDPIDAAIERNIYVLDSLARADQRQPGIRVGAYHLLGPNDMRALESAGMLVLDNPGACTMMALTDRGREFLAQSVPFDPGTGPVPGYVAGRCGHRVAESEWRAGFRVCEHCPTELPEGGEVG